MATNITDLPYNTKTDLPSRDIPRETITHVADPQVTPTYMPPKEQPYIEHQPTYTEQSKFDKFIEEFRLPLLVAVLYFLFETPTIQSMLVRFAPSLFTETTGLLSKSICFGAMYYSAMMGADYLSKP
jgi:hypothetical protein